jgi:DNA-binding transcriptional MerR regulator
MSAEWQSIILARRDVQRLTLEELAAAARLHPDLIETLVSFGLLEPVARDGPRLLFDASAVLRLRAIQRLRQDLGVNLAGIGVILDLTERLRRLEQELDWWRGRLESR